MKIFILLSLVILSLCPTKQCFADPPDDLDTRLVDTIVRYNNVDFRVRRITRAEFDSLHSTYRKTPSTPERDLRKVEKMLSKKYTLIYDAHTYNDTLNIYTLKELRHKDKLRVLIGESDGFQAYYPRERIILYYGGHSGDQAFFVDTGEQAYNPEYSTFSANGKYSLTGLHSGQDDVIYELSKYCPKQKRLMQLCHLRDIMAQLPYETYIGRTDFVFEQFWVNNTLYFRVGWQEREDDWTSQFRFIAITVPK